MSASKAQSRAVSKWKKENYAKVQFDCPKDDKPRLKAAAAARNKSVAALIVAAVNQYCGEQVLTPLGEPVGIAAKGSHSYKDIYREIEAMTSQIAETEQKKQKTSHSKIEIQLTEKEINALFMIVEKAASGMKTEQDKAKTE